MILKVFGIYDTKSACYPSTPIFALTTPAGIRIFSDLVNDPESHLNKHASDYVFMELGTFDNGCGRFQCPATPVNLGLGTDFIKVPERKIPNFPGAVVPGSEVTNPPSNSPSNGKVEVLK